MPTYQHVLSALDYEVIAPRVRPGPLDIFPRMCDCLYKRIRPLCWCAVPGWLALSHGELGNKAAAAADPSTTNGSVLENKRASVRDQLLFHWGVSLHRIQPRSNLGGRVNFFLPSPDFRVQAPGLFWEAKSRTAFGFIPPGLGSSSQRRLGGGGEGGILSWGTWQRKGTRTL